MGKNNNYNKNFNGRNKNIKGTNKPHSKDNQKYKDCAPDEGKYTKGADSYDGMTTNDVSWYNKQKSLFDLSTRIPFNQIAGLPVNVTPSVSVEEDFNEDAAIPGIMTIDYVPGVGLASSHTDASNRAFQAMFTAILSKTSSSRLDFTPANLALLVTAQQSVAQNIAAAKRLLKIANMYSAQNMYYPKAIITALGFDSSTVIDQRADLTWALNNAIRDFNTMRVPNMLDTFKRHYFLAKSIFADQDSIAAQLYMFRPAGYYVYSDLGQYNGEAYDGKARLCYYDFNYAAADLQDLINTINLQIQMIRNSSDYSLINGTLQRAYSDSQFVRIDELSVNDELQPIVDEVMAYQIHNMTIPGKLFPNRINIDQPNIDAFMASRNTTLNDITCDYVNNLLLYSPEVVIGSTLGSAFAEDFLLNTFSNTVDSDFIMESTRLTSAVNEDGTFHSLGTEFVTDINIWTMFRDSNGNMEVKSFPDNVFEQGCIDTETQQLGSMLQAVGALTKFHRAPHIRMVDTETNAIFGMVGDLNFFTLVSREALDKLHATALLSIFDTEAVMQVK